MRNRLTTTIGALLLTFAASASAQTPPPSVVPTSPEAPTIGALTGTIDFGFRGDSSSGDVARYQRYSDLRQGAFTQIVFGKETDQFKFGVRADNVGYNDQRNVGCVSCHSAHAPKGAQLLKAKVEPELCATCHRNVTNKLHRFNHMPVREEKLACSSCHNPHGSTNVKLLKVGTTVDESCTSCHAEKRGPYLWEHAPVANACVTCHDPHGSNNDRMLAAKVPFLCQRCHVTSRHPPTVYEGFLLGNSTNANKMIGRGCVACHSQIHGSNAPSGKAFLR